MSIAREIKNINIFITITFLLLLFTSTAATSKAEGLTEKTGQEMLKELKELNKSLREMKAGNKKPEPPKDAKVTTKGGAILGDKNAPVTLVEFTDYQCPFCKRFMDTTFVELKKKYIDTGKVKFVSRNLPLPFHKEARSAAEAVMCAGDQDKESYWEMRDIAFKNPRALFDDDLNKYAVQLSLNLSKFKKCMASDKHIKQIDKDMADASAIGINGTPSFVVAPSTGTELTGEVIIGAQPFPAFDKVIQKMLKK